jgi:hypothetical protein
VHHLQCWLPLHRVVWRLCDQRFQHGEHRHCSLQHHQRHRAVLVRDCHHHRRNSALHHWRRRGRSHRQRG